MLFPFNLTVKGEMTVNWTWKLISKKNTQSGVWLWFAVGLHTRTRTNTRTRTHILSQCHRVVFSSGLQRSHLDNSPDLLPTGWVLLSVCSDHSGRSSFILQITKVKKSGLSLHLFMYIWILKSVFISTETDETDWWCFFLWEVLNTLWQTFNQTCIMIFLRMVTLYLLCQLARWVLHHLKWRHGQSVSSCWCWETLVHMPLRTNSQKGFSWFCKHFISHVVRRLQREEPSRFNLDGLKPDFGCWSKTWLKTANNKRDPSVYVTSTSGASCMIVEGKWIICQWRSVF